LKEEFNKLPLQTNYYRRNVEIVRRIAGKQQGAALSRAPV